MTTPSTPTWRDPSSLGDALPVGLLSNKRGSNATTDAISMAARYSNPRASADPALAMRVVAKRTVTQGTPQVPTTTWDSGWVGGVTVNALPIAVHSHQTVFANGRIYVIGGQDTSHNLHSEVWSAPFNGGSVGTWRREIDYPFPVAGHSACAVAMNQAAFDSKQFIYVYGGGVALNALTPTYATVTNRCWFAPINSDGTLGGWTEFATPLIQFNGVDAPRMFGTLFQAAWWKTPAAPYSGLPVLMYAGGTDVNAASAGNGVFATGNSHPDVFIMTLNQDGSQYHPNYWIINTLPAGRYGCFGMFDFATNYILIMGGSEGTAAQTTLQYSYWNPELPIADPSNTTWSTNATGLPGARNGMAGIYTPNWDNSNLGRVILFGGTIDPSIPSATNQYPDAIFTASGQGITSTTWNTFTNGLPTYCSAGAVASMEARSGTIPGTHWVALVGGLNNSTTAISTVLTASAVPPSWTANYGTWQSPGTGTALSSSLLGTGSALGSNQDGTLDFTFNYGAFGQTMLSSFSDGDQVQVGVQFLDRLGGDASPMAYTLIKIGQPPTVSSVTPANAGSVTSGSPSLSFLYNAGAGGGPQYSYEIQVKRGSAVLFDSGTLYNNSNAVSLNVAPALAPSTTYTMVITAESEDDSYPGSTEDVTSTTTFTTTAFTVPATPGSFTATPSATNANVSLSWGAVSGAIGYNVYHRRTGTSTWVLLASLVSTPSYVAMDHVALGVAYDFGVSAINSSLAESAMATATNVTIPLGSWSAYIHVAGTTTGLPLQINDSPQVARKLDVTSLFAYGQGAPITRYGTVDYRALSFTALLLDATPASLKTLQSIIAAVQAGGVCFYRDALGGMLVVTVDAEQDISILPPFYRQPVLKLTETLDTIGPYVTAGSAQGYLTLVNGSRPALDTSETML